MSSSGGGEQLDNLEGAKTELPDDGKKVESQETKADKKKKKKKKKDTETKEDGGGKKDTILNYPLRHPFKTALGAGAGAATLIGLSNRKGTKRVVSDPTKPHGGLHGDDVGVEDEGRNGMNVDVDGGRKGKMSDKERTALLRHLMNKPRLNKNTQTNKNWVR